MCGTRAGTGGPDPPEKSQKYGVSYQYWSRSQSYQASIQCWAIIGPPAKRNLNGDDGPRFSAIWILSPLIKENKTKKTLSKLDPL